MTQARKDIVNLGATPYYHVISRCVRRAYLCGLDELTKKDFNHRKQWLVDKIFQLSTIFCIDICAYAIMSNHYHLVLHIDRNRAQNLSDRDVAIRWMRLFRGHSLVRDWLNTPVNQLEPDSFVAEVIKEWRKRLYDLGWYMQCLNQYIAIRANQEDECTGRFWEGRYKSQALLDEAALLTCMTYVDLNPIRAGISTTPENSDFTSIQRRIKALARNTRFVEDNVIDSEVAHRQQPNELSPFANYRTSSKEQKGLPFNLLDYIELVDWSACSKRDDKTGEIPKHIQPIFMRFQIDENYWQQLIHKFNYHFRLAAGSSDRLRKWALLTGRKWCKKHGGSNLYKH
ncbi:transposase [Thalassotalea mangrovi]|uniref:Transposase n=1 Tax=Thalassotalea mangrovi TaxID=2572245 RepID=A0A4U1B2H3_9GAMM|nr:transposase [Thalassotalea mangrovi]TKB43274.1 transposase [Thalassotalea mangrovi]